mgnify:CR=1
SKQKSEGFDVHAPPWRERRRGLSYIINVRVGLLEHPPEHAEHLVDEDAVHLETEERGF